jgi:hypothetical protein
MGHWGSCKSNSWESFYCNNFNWGRLDRSNSWDSSYEISNNRDSSYWSSNNRGKSSRKSSNLWKMNGMGRSSSIAISSWVRVDTILLWKTPFTFTRIGPADAAASRLETNCF